ncbi:MAG: hypothetical protein ACR2KT_03210 [Methylocella sp.]|nr:MAG: hypothetical protein DLM68_00030 [Hyphomicrobiales bacterium]
MLTLIFAVAVAGILAALFLLGLLSDQIGRRPVLIGGVVLTDLGSAAFMLAQSVAWRFVARLFQGQAAAWSRACLAARRRRDGAARSREGPCREPQRS